MGIITTAAAIGAITVASHTQPSPAEAARQQQPTAEIGNERGEPIMLDSGRRAAALQHKWATLRTVVLVPDEKAYLQALGRWTRQARYPVLIDDGSHASALRVGRFVRAFAPDRVVLWDGDSAAVDRTDNTDNPARLRNAVEQAIDRTWVPTADETRAATGTAQRDWTIAQGHRPPGVVLASATDPAWVAAAAIAIGRGLPVVWVAHEPASISATMPRERAETLENELRAGLGSTGLAWDALGDDVDAVAVCLNAADKVESGDGLRALTDWIGRHDKATEQGIDRYAWASLVHGDEPEAAYRAMCGLFLAPATQGAHNNTGIKEKPKTAWLFNGYSDERINSAYGLGPVAESMAKLGVESTTHEDENAAAWRWRKHGERGIDDGLVFVNTSGHRSFFEIQPGKRRVYASDVPDMRTPAMVYFIHSFSAQRADDKRSVAGCWFEHGAYAYAGSVDEPYLNAFPPARLVASRLAAGAGFAAAVRVGIGPRWKINAYGDPLATVAWPPARKDGDPPLPDATDIDEAWRFALLNENYDAAAHGMTVMGHDAKLAKLAKGLVAQRPDAITEPVAVRLLHALHRTGNAETMAAVYKRLGSGAAADPTLRGILWRTLRPALRRTEDPAVPGLLLKHVRTGVPDADAADDLKRLAPAAKRLLGAEAFRAAALRAIEKEPDDTAQRAMRDLLKGR